MKKNTTTTKCTLTVEMWAIARVKPYPKNARKLSDNAVAKVAASLKEFGWRQPCVVDKKGVLVAGHTRLLAAQSLGMTEVPVHVAANLTPVQCRAYRLADNRVASESSFDLELLGPELLELQALDLDLSLTGFDADELKMFMADPTEGLTDPDDCPAPQAQAISKLGDLWCLGEHRLLVGDSTSVTDVERLMAGEKADTMWTDPPYGVSYVGKTKSKLTIENDGGDTLEELLHGFLAAASTVLAPSAPFYIAHPAGARFLVFGKSVEDAGWRIHQNLVWVKDSMVLGHSDYHFQHEPILYGYTPGDGRPGRGNHPGSRWVGDHAQVSIFQIPRPKRSEAHPTMKPVELVKRCLLNSTPPGGIVYEPFGGSGSTMTACQEAGLKCRAMELSPQYADVICRRFMAFTGKQATLESGRTFAELEAERKPKSAVA